MITVVTGEIVEWKSRASDAMHSAIVVHQLDPERTLVRDRKMRYPQVILTERLSRPRSVPTLCGPSGKVA